MSSCNPEFIQTTHPSFDDVPASGAMEGGGAYNKHAKLQATSSASALPCWERSVGRVALDHGDQPIVIADYGSSQGKNSLAPMRIAIEILRSRVGPERPILVCHIDLPINDFNALFGLLAGGPGCYSRLESKVYSCAVGRSFYESVLPPNHVHVGWSSYAAMWISRIPTSLRGHIFVPSSTVAERSAFERQGAQDWETFLSLRAKELRPGGRLVVVVPGARDDGLSGFENIMNHANAALVEMVDEGTITADEYERMALGVWQRRRQDLLAPFAANGRFQDLIVESYESTALADNAWADYQRDGKLENLVNNHAAFFRSTFAPSLASALRLAREPEICRAFSESLEHKLKRRLMHEPAPINSLVVTIVLAKLEMRRL
jgi:SAM dependent carboxyl methyltransferase